MIKTSFLKGKYKLFMSEVKEEMYAEPLDIKRITKSYDEHSTNKVINTE